MKSDVVDSYQDSVLVCVVTVGHGREPGRIRNSSEGRIDDEEYA